MLQDSIASTRIFGCCHISIILPIFALVLGGLFFEDNPEQVGHLYHMGVVTSSTNLETGGAAHFLRAMSFLPEYPEIAMEIFRSRNCYANHIAPLVVQTDSTDKHQNNSQ